VGRLRVGVSVGGTLLRWDYERDKDRAADAWGRDEPEWWDGGVRRINTTRGVNAWLCKRKRRHAGRKVDQRRRNDSLPKISYKPKTHKLLV